MSDTAKASIKRLRSFILSIRIKCKDKLFFIFYDFVEELYIFFEFCKVCFIFVIENCSFFGYENDIERQISKVLKRYIIESSSPEVPVHTSACNLGGEEYANSPMFYFVFEYICDEHIRKERLSF